VSGILHIFFGGGAVVKDGGSMQKTPLRILLVSNAIESPIGH
jgi:hypothetical protein